MPYIDVHIAAETLAEETVKKLSAGITDIMSDILRKNRKLVAVSIVTISPNRWFISGQQIKSNEKTTAFVTARITGGTNTEAEKSRAIQAIEKLLSDELGIMEEATYIVLQSIPAEDWGYSGQTQKSRYETVRRLQNGAIDTKHYLRRARELRSVTLFVLFQRILRKFRRKSPAREIKVNPAKRSSFTG